MAFTEEEKKEKQKIAVAKYHAKNKDKIKKYQKAYYVENRDKLMEYASKAYRDPEVRKKRAENELRKYWEMEAKRPVKPKGNRGRCFSPSELKRRELRSKPIPLGA